MRVDIRQPVGHRRGIGASVLGAAPTAQARDFFSSLFGAFSDNPALAPSRPEPSRAMPFASEGDFFGRPAEQPRPRVSYGGRRSGLLRAHLRRTLFPDHGGRWPEPRRVLQQLLPGQRDQGGLRQQHRPAPRPTTENPIPNCRTRSAIATSWSRAAPATARTSSASRRSKSRTIRRCARATSSPAQTGWWSPAAPPTGAVHR